MITTPVEFRGNSFWQQFFHNCWRVFLGPIASNVFNPFLLEKKNWVSVNIVKVDMQTLPLHIFITLMYNCALQESWEKFYIKKIMWNHLEYIYNFVTIPKFRLSPTVWQIVDLLNFSFYYKICFRCSTLYYSSQKVIFSCW